MENSHTQTTSLHHCHVHKLKAVLYLSHSLSHFLALVTIFYYRAIFFLDKAGFKLIPFLLWLVLFAAELLFSFIWFLKQPFYWWPVTRTIFTERLPKDEKLPGIDVFICTTDPKKEPTFEVMNTVISAMSLDYPAEKLSVYLSDDGGDSVTLNGIKEAWVFAIWWLPFCRRYNVKTICPRAYFEKPEEASQSWEFVEDRNTLQVWLINIHFSPDNLQIPHPLCFFNSTSQLSS
ncbi:cellulose synthase-like protein E6 [Chenopodium quinoa]|uniref:cellulose synthase-like protein E6 n=1 Tax=Chenopodium quinoa TaxID=63459 RepID=UPI000B775630|nr:cellulose synthase-like protein E6 [Chenopodium quinoa]